MNKPSAASAALIAALMATAGGYAFLQKHHEPTLREVFAACEKGELNGMACCEDVLTKDCAPISKEHPDPLGIRALEESDFDILKAKQEKANEAH